MAAGVLAALGAELAGAGVTETDAAWAAGVEGEGLAAGVDEAVLDAVGREAHVAGA